MIKRSLAILLSMLMIVTQGWSQTRAKGAIVLKGNITFGAPVSGSGPFFAQLPVNYVNAGLTTGTGFCSPPGGIYDATKTMPGDYAATFAGLAQAKTDQVAANQWWLLKVAAGTNIHGSSYNGDSALLTWPTSGSVTKCLVIQSSTHNTDGQIVCAHGLPGFGGTRDPNCTTDVAKMWQFTIDAPGGTFGMLFPTGESYIALEDMEGRPLANTNQSSNSSNPQLIVASQGGNHIILAYDWFHGWNPGDVGQPAGACTTTGSWHRSSVVNTSGITVTWVSGDQFGMDYSDGTHSTGYPAVTSGGSNPLVINGSNFTIASHDPAASATTLTVGASAGTQTGVTMTLVNPATAYANGCGDDSRGVQLLGNNIALEYSQINKIHWWGGESHDVSIGFSNGPILLAELWLEPGSNGIFSGGSEIDTRGGPLQDLEVGNVFVGRDLGWRFLSAGNGTSPAPPFGAGPLDGNSSHDTSPFNWAIKNNIELKECNRCWFHGVIVDGSWPDGQSGHLFSLTIRSASGGDVAGVYDPSTGVPMTPLSNIRVDNFWLRNASQAIGLGSRSLGPGNGGGLSQFVCCIDFLNGIISNVKDDSQFGNSSGTSPADVIGVSSAGQVYLGTFSRTGGVAHAVVAPMNIANYDPGSGNIHNNIGTYQTAFNISSIVNIQSAGPVNTVTIKLNSQRTDPKVGGQFTMANVSGWNGTFNVASVKTNNGNTTTVCSQDNNGNTVSAAIATQPQPCIRADGTFGDTIVYTDNVNTFGAGTTTLCSSKSTCDSQNSQALLDTLAYKMADIAQGNSLYVHNCSGGSLGNPMLFQVGASAYVPAVAPTVATGLDVYYTNAGSDDSGVSCQIENSSGTPQLVSVQNTSILSPQSMAMVSNGLSGQAYKNYFLHNTLATTGTAAGVTCTGVGGEGTAAFACWDLNSFQFFDNVLQGRTSGSWSVVPGASSPNFTSPSPSTVTCSGATATSACLGYTGYMSATAFPTTGCSYDGSDPTDCPLMAAPWSNNFSTASITPVGTSSYTSEGVNLTTFNTVMNATQGVCPVGSYCGSHGPYPY